MRTELVEPNRLARVRLAGEHPRGPFVVARTQLRIPGTGVCGPVIDQIEIGIVRDPSPYVTAADFPHVRRPARYAQVLPPILRVMRLEGGADEHLLVGPRAVGAPGDLSALRVERRQPAAHAELAPAVADQHFVL